METGAQDYVSGRMGIDDFSPSPTLPDEETIIDNEKILDETVEQIYACDAKSEWLRLKYLQVAGHHLPTIDRSAPPELEVHFLKDDIPF